MPWARRSPYEDLKQSFCFVSKQLKKNWGGEETIFSGSFSCSNRKKNPRPRERPNETERETDFEKETGGQDTERLQSLDYFLENGGSGEYVIFI